MKSGAGKEIHLTEISIRDSFWSAAIELVRQEILPYQWEILNNRVPDAAPSFCMRNFRIAGKLTRKLRTCSSAGEQPKYTYRGFEVLPEDMAHLEDRFYGFVFQDSDFYKWIEAVSYCLASHPDSELEKLADEAIDVVCAAQQENGYLDTYYIISGMDQIFTNLKDHHELYCMGHLVEGGVAYYEATGKDKLLRAAMNFADYVVSVFGEEEGKCKGYPGHEIAEMALMRLYEVTGKEQYLKLAQFFINQRGQQPCYWRSEKGYKPGDEALYAYNQSHLPVREQNEAVGHAVRAMYLYCGMADLARVTEDEELWDACKRLWESAVHEKMYITGGVGATCEGEAFSFPYDLPNDLAYAETCASVGLIFWAWRMLKKEANSEYGDIMELALYNTVLSGMSLDGKRFFYVNPLEVFPEACHKDVRKAHVKSLRQKWFGCACCPPNLARTIASVGKYAFTEDETTFWIHLYVGADVTVNGCPVSISSAFPWEGYVTLEIHGDMAETFSFAFRTPGWCESCELLADSGAKSQLHSGYLYLTKQWKKGDIIQMNFPMQAAAMEANPLVREDIGKAAIRRGPMIYCMEEADNGKNLHLLTIKLPLEAEEKRDFMLGHNFIKINVKGERYQLNSSQPLYRRIRIEQPESTTLKYVPYYMWNNRGEGEMQVWTRYSC